MLKKQLRKPDFYLKFLFVRPKCFCSERIGTNFSKFASENKDSCLSRNHENRAARFSSKGPSRSRSHPLHVSISKLPGAGKPVPSDTEWSDLMKERPESERRPGGCWPQLRELWFWGLELGFRVPIPDHQIHQVRVWVSHSQPVSPNPFGGVD